MHVFLKGKQEKVNIMKANRPKLSQNALARALGLSAASVTKSKAMGMPVDSVEAATRWRNQNLRQDLRTRPSPNLPATSSRQEVEALALLALNALQLGEFGLIAPRLRAAMRALPAHDLDELGLPVEVWDALTNHVGTAITSSGDIQPALDDAQAARMGVFWFDVACGRPAEVP